MHEAQKIPNKLNSKRATPRHIVNKMSKIKGKAAREMKEAVYKRTLIRLFSQLLLNRNISGQENIQNVEEKTISQEVYNHQSSPPEKLR